VVMLLFIKDSVYPKMRDGARIPAEKQIVEP
jgi:hypothetical protein